MQSFVAAIKRVCNEKHFFDHDRIANSVREQYGVRKIAESYASYINEIRGIKNKSIR